MIALPLISLITVSSWAIVLAYLERKIPYQKNYRIFRSGFWSDLIWYTLIQSYVLSFIIAEIIHRCDAIFGLSKLALLAHWNFLSQLIFFIVIHDFWQYWFHRFEHRTFFFWRIHEAAHAPLHVDWLSGSQSHFFEILIAQTVEFAPIFLLGGTPELAVTKAMIDAVWGMFNHSNLDIRMGPLLYILNGPELHRWHHDIYAPKGGVNLSTKLALWDRLFGTAYYPKSGLPTYGLPKEIDFPYENYFKQLVFVFRKKGVRQRA